MFAIYDTRGRRFRDTLENLRKIGSTGHLLIGGNYNAGARQEIKRSVFDIEAFRQALNFPPI